MKLGTCPCLKTRHQGKHSLHVGIISHRAEMKLGYNKQLGIQILVQTAIFENPDIFIIKKFTKKRQ